MSERSEPVVGGRYVVQTRIERAYPYTTLVVSEYGIYKRTAYAVWSKGCLGICATGAVLYVIPYHTLVASHEQYAGAVFGDGVDAQCIVLVSLSKSQRLESRTPS